MGNPTTRPQSWRVPTHFNRSGPRVPILSALVFPSNPWYTEPICCVCERTSIRQLDALNSRPRYDHFQLRGVRRVLPILSHSLPTGAKSILLIPHMHFKDQVLQMLGMTRFLYLLL